ncbi:MAG: pyridoxamine 5'-phosphate oxidase family protein [Acidobacteria bacterium]|nr:pyridoxamine 5'-phosphate oxidase family protein [Acidobacteriota bacterium]
MDTESRKVLAGLVGRGCPGSLATLREGGPSVGMVLCAPDGEGAFLIHVSRLAAHTGDLLADPRVALLLVGPAPGGNPQAAPRVSLRGRAAEVPRESPGGQAAARAYLAAFPQAEAMFGFGDFLLFRIVPEEVRFVGGFAKAFDVAPSELKELQESGAAGSAS